MDWRRCLQKDLSTRSEVAQTVPTASVSSDLIGAWRQAPSQSCPLNRPAAALREVGMLEVTSHENMAATRVVIGTDTHQEQHVAVAIDRQGALLGERHAVATTSGYRGLERWSSNLGTIHAFGIEGTGSYGAGIARFLTGLGYCVVEVNRPDRSTRYRNGKSDASEPQPSKATPRWRRHLADRQISRCLELRKRHLRPRGHPRYAGNDTRPL